MVRNIKNGSGLISFFGNGSVRIKPYTLKNRYAGQVELSECHPQNLGSEVLDENVDVTKPKMVLDFNNIESLDVFILKLQELRSEMEDEKRDATTSA